MSNVFSGVCTLGNDAVVRYLPSGQAVLNVRLANRVGFGDRAQTLWINGAVWGKKAESNLKTFLVKGQQVFVSGELTMSEYKANDGTMKTSLELNASIIDLVGGKRESSDGGYDAPALVGQYAPQQPQYQQPPAPPAYQQQPAPQVYQQPPTQNYAPPPPPSYAPQQPAAPRTPPVDPTYEDDIPF